MVIDLYLQNKRVGVGMGRRRFVVITVGHKLATLFYPLTCTTFTVPKTELDNGTPVKTSHGLARIIKTNLQDRLRRGKRVNEAAAKAALKQLKGTNA